MTIQSLGYDKQERSFSDGVFICDEKIFII